VTRHPKPEPAAKDDTSEDGGFVGPSPNAETNRILASILLTGGVELVRRGLERGLLGKGYAPNKARKLLKATSLGQSLAGAAVTKLATRSVPGAILVGGGLLAKTLYERRKGKAARAKIEPSASDMPDDEDTRGY